MVDENVARFKIRVLFDLTVIGGGREYLVTRALGIQIRRIETGVSSVWPELRIAHPAVNQVQDDSEVTRASRHVVLVNIELTD